MRFERANQTAPKDKIKLLNAYKDAADKAIDLNWDIYEACEYYESACFYYLKGDYETASSELETGNDKILSHDAKVKDYNAAVARIEVLESY